MYSGTLVSVQSDVLLLYCISGGSVANYLAKEGPLRERIALRILQQVLSGLAFMHKLHVIHGDIKGGVKIFQLSRHYFYADSFVLSRGPVRIISY